VVSAIFLLVPQRGVAGFYYWSWTELNIFYRSPFPTFESKKYCEVDYSEKESYINLAKVATIFWGTSFDSKRGTQGES